MGTGQSSSRSEVTAETESSKETCGAGISQNESGKLFSGSRTSPLREVFNGPGLHGLGDNLPLTVEYDFALVAIQESSYARSEPRT
jgi:hypothetical protein